MNNFVSAPLKGVNLGGWLIIERWMTPSLFEGTDAVDEKSFSLSGAVEREKIAQHHHEFITENDFKWLKRHNINALRIPVGYWIFGDEPPFVGSIDRLDFAFAMAEKYNLKVLLDIHGAAGSQNGKRHSGMEGTVNWHKHRHKTLAVTEKLASRYRASPALWGVELLNEPKIGAIHALRLVFYYKNATRLIRKYCNKKIKVVISGDKWPYFWSKVAVVLGATLDVHYYHSFGSRNRFKPSQVHLENAQKSRHAVEKLQRRAPVIVGEWSAVLGSSLSPEATDNDRNELMRRYAKMQMESYEGAAGWFYWSYKAENEGSWNFRSLVEKGIISV